MTPRRAVTYVEIDGIKCVTGVTDPIPDPEATLELARLEIAAQGYKNRFDDLILRGKAPKPDDTETFAVLKRDVTRYALEHARAVRDYARANPVYFPHVPGERLVEPSQADEVEAKLKTLGKHERLTVDGTVIPDNRGRAYYHEQGGVWHRTQISTIGQTKPAGCRWEADLGEADLREIQYQEERQRIEKLTLTERRIQAAMEIEMAAKSCANMRSTLEIKGENNALAIARDQFEKLKLEIIQRYNLTENGDSNGGRNKDVDPNRQADRGNRSPGTKTDGRGDG